MHNKTKQVEIEFSCEFCGALGGSLVLEVPVADNKTYTKDELGFVDHRCDACTALYGNFKTMTLKYEEQTGATPTESEAFVKQNRKKENFDAALAKEVAKLKAERDDKI